MKKIFLLLVTAATVTFTSCNNDDDRPVVDNDTIGITFERTVSFSSAFDYAVTIPLTDYQVLESDVVLVYRQTGVDGGNPVWRSVPQTLYFPDGELEYISDFTVNDVVINVDFSQTLDLNNYQGFFQNQLFRIVIVPSDFASQVNVNDYNEVISLMNKNRN